MVAKSHTTARCRRAQSAAPECGGFEDAGSMIIATLAEPTSDHRSTVMVEALRRVALMGRGGIATLSEGADWEACVLEQPLAIENEYSSPLNHSVGNSLTTRNSDDLTEIDDTPVEEWGGSSMHNTVDVQKIVSEVRALDPHAFKSWESLASNIDGVEFVGMQISDANFDVLDGSFEGFGRLMIRFPAVGLMGERVMGSKLVPTRVTGKIARNNSVMIEDVAYRL